MVTLINLVCILNETMQQYHEMKLDPEGLYIASI